MMKKICISTKLGMREVLADVHGPVAVHGAITHLCESRLTLSEERFVIVHVASGGKLTLFTTFSMESAQWAAQNLAQVPGWECMDQFIGAAPIGSHGVREEVPVEFFNDCQAILKSAAERDDAAWNRNMEARQ
jgi:hypothetical protein